MQYALAMSKDDINESNWQYIDFDTADNPKIKISPNNSGKKLFFKIKRESPSGINNNAADQIKDLYSYYNTYGQYYVQVVKKSGGSVMKCDEDTSGVIQSIIKKVKEILVGTKKDSQGHNIDYENGALQKVFTGFLSQKIRDIIKILVVIYLSFFAISFMSGIIEISQQDFVKRLLKLGIVFTLMSDHAWQFFGGYLVPLFIDGSIELISYVASESYGDIVGVSKACILKEPYVIFDVFDGPLTQLFSAAVWKKIYAMLLTGLLGFFGTVMVVMGIVYYTLTVLKVAVMYLFSIVMTSLCIAMAPVFLTLFMFESQVTKHLFDSWMKNLISYALQPFFVFTSVIIFNIVIMMLILVVFNYTVCSVCLFYVDLSPFYEACWWPGYHNVLSYHLPGDVPHYFMPLNIFVGGWAFYMGCSMMLKFSGFIAMLTSMIVTSSPIRHASIAEPADQFERKGKVAAASGAAYVASKFKKNKGNSGDNPDDTKGNQPRNDSTNVQLPE